VLWRRDPADELLAVVAEIADREYDRLDALGCAACIGTMTARELSQLGLQEILKARNAVRRSRGARPTRSSRPKVTRTRPQTSDPSRHAHRLRGVAHCSSASRRGLGGASRSRCPRR
jgi:hypothetical protein